MIHEEVWTTRDDGVVLVRTYSDKAMKIRQETGAVYDVAIDAQGHRHTYSETDEPVDEEFRDSDLFKNLG